MDTKFITRNISCLDSVNVVCAANKNPEPELRRLAGASYNQDIIVDCGASRIHKKVDITGKSTYQITGPEFDVDYWLSF